MRKTAFQPAGAVGVGSADTLVGTCAGAFVVAVTGGFAGGFGIGLFCAKPLVTVEARMITAMANCRVMAVVRSEVRDEAACEVLTGE